MSLAVPLDEFQKAVLRTLMKLRSPASAFAGGSVLQRHGFRLSDDQDIFHDTGSDLPITARRDIDALRSAGFTVQPRRPFEGLIEATVTRAGEGITRIQWMEAGAWNFFAPVPDTEFGWRLHMADLAVNKALAAGGRRQARDYVDLFLIHRHIMPLWHAIWAAPGKDESWSPASLAEKIAHTNNFRQVDIAEEVVSTMPLDAAEIGRTIRDALEQARGIFPMLPPQDAGKLYVDSGGNIVSDISVIRDAAGRVRAIAAERGGTWPSGPEIDHVLIGGLVAAFGRDGTAAAQAGDSDQA